MSVNNSITRALVGLVVVVLVAGLLMGLAFSDTNLLNWLTAKAEADEIKRASRRQAQIDAIDVKYYEQEREVQAKEREQQYRQETAFQQEKHEQALEHQHRRQILELTLLQIRQGVLLSVGALVMLAVGGAAAFYLISLGREKQRLKRDPWQSSGFRESMRLMAQVNERLLRELRLSRQKTGEAAGIGGDGHQETAVGDG